MPNKLDKKQIAEFFVYGLWTAADVDKAAVKGRITAEEAEEIKALEGTDALEAYKAKAE